MRLVGYTRTHYSEQLGERDLEEQERAIAEFCAANNHELTNVVVDEGDSHDAMYDALQQDVDGIVVIDPLVVADDVGTAHDIAAEMIKRNKHLFMVYRQRHIEPDSRFGEQELVDSCINVMDKKAS